MSTFLPKDVEEGLRAAVIANQRRRSKMRVEADGDSYKMLRVWQNGFSVAAEDAPKLRGLVDLYDAGRHLGQALIVASEEVAGEICYDFKRNTMAADRAPLDFARDLDAPIALLPDGR
ncbi:MAG: hypothetical protein VX378_06825 [Pseudomonadota bacterium]|nr:hypothetical protein [Pseudomonadota bacterium]MEE3070800.1 hypothetical protein [Pseudomonadota bacterium]